MYALLLALAALVYGRFIFRGNGVHPRFAMWQYAFITMIIVIAPTVGSTASGVGAGEQFWSRQLLFMAVALYGAFAVNAFDSLFPPKKNPR